MVQAFTTKAQARQHVWDRLLKARAARFPFPPHGRIANFAGAREAAERLLAHPAFAEVRRIKANPDAPQRNVREGALRRGIVVYVPAPRLRGGFVCLDPRRIPQAKLAEAASLSGARRWGEEVGLEELPQLDLVVTGSVAVTCTGRRCGKGHGYGDIEYAILRELGHAPVLVATTVHPLQIVGSFPTDAHDLPVSLIVTPEESIRVETPPPAPAGIDWDALAPQALAQMPVLQALRELKAHARSAP